MAKSNVKKAVSGKRLAVSKKKAQTKTTVSGKQLAVKAKKNVKQKPVGKNRIAKKAAEIAAKKAKSAGRRGDEKVIVLNTPNEKFLHDVAKVTAENAKKIAEAERANPNKRALKHKDFVAGLEPQALTGPKVSDKDAVKKNNEALKAAKNSATMALSKGGKEIKAKVKSEADKAAEIAAKKAAFAESLKRRLPVNTNEQKQNFDAALDSKKVRAKQNPVNTTPNALAHTNGIPVSLPADLNDMLVKTDEFVRSFKTMKATHQIVEFVQKLGGDVEVQNPSPEIRQQARFKISFNGQTATLPADGYLRVSR